MHDRVACHAPGSTAAPTHSRLHRRNAQPQKCGFTSLAAVPPLPEPERSGVSPPSFPANCGQPLADMASDPSFSIEGGPPEFGEAVIAPPAFHIALPLIPQFHTGQRLSGVPFLPDLILESGEAGGRYGDEQRHGQCKPEERSGAT
jgi:hypothetical protein